MAGIPREDSAPAPLRLNKPQQDLTYKDDLTAERLSDLLGLPHRTNVEGQSEEQLTQCDYG